MARALNLLPYAYCPELLAVRSAMPLAFIVDDRKDVWEPMPPPYNSAASRQVFLVRPFTYYNEATSAKVDGTSLASSVSGREMLRVPLLIRALHERMFAAIDASVLRHTDGKTLRNPLPLDDLFGGYKQALGPAPWVERLMESILEQVPEPQAPPEATPPLPVPVMLALVQQKGLVSLQTSKSVQVPSSQQEQQPLAVPMQVADPRLQYRPPPTVPQVRPMANVATKAQDWTLAWQQGLAQTNKRPREDREDDDINTQLEKKRSLSSGDRLTPSHPVVLLSQRAQKDARHVSYSFRSNNIGTWNVVVRYGAGRHGRNPEGISVSTQGRSMEDAKANAAVAVLRHLGLDEVVNVGKEGVLYNSNRGMRNQSSHDAYVPQGAIERNDRVVQQRVAPRELNQNHLPMRNATMPSSSSSPKLMGPPFMSGRVGREEAVDVLQQHVQRIGAKMDMTMPHKAGGQCVCRIVIYLRTSERVVSEGEGKFEKWAQQVASLKLLEEIGYAADWSKPPPKPRPLIDGSGTGKASNRS